MHTSRHLRRTLALLLGVLLPLALTGCVKDFATDRVNTISAGVDNRDADVDVLHAVIVSSEAGSGTFVASFANNDFENELSVDALEGVDQAQITAEEFTAITIAPGALVNLANEGGIPVTGDFEAGNFVPVSVQFSNGQSVQLNVPVVTNCGDYEGLDEGTGDCEAPEAPEGAH